MKEESLAIASLIYLISPFVLGIGASLIFFFRTRWLFAEGGINEEKTKASKNKVIDVYKINLANSNEDLVEVAESLKIKYEVVESTLNPSSMDFIRSEVVLNKLDQVIIEEKYVDLYFIRSPFKTHIGYEVKIGFSSDFQNIRLKDYRFYWRDKFEVLNVVQGKVADEFKLHEYFSSFHISGEFFDFSEELIVQIKLSKSLEDFYSLPLKTQKD